MQEIIDNLAIIKAVKDYEKLRIIPVTETPVSPDVTLATHKFAIDERYMQGVQRRFSGDGHAANFAFVRLLLRESVKIAVTASQEYMQERISSKEHRQNIYDETPIAVLLALKQALVGAEEGLQRMRRTTYADSQQIAIDLDTLIKNTRYTHSRIQSFLETPDNVTARQMSQVNVTGWAAPPSSDSPGPPFDI